MKQIIKPVLLHEGEFRSIRLISHGFRLRRLRSLNNFTLIHQSKLNVMSTALNSTYSDHLNI